MKPLIDAIFCHSTTEFMQLEGKVSKGLSHISTTVDPDWKGPLLIAVHNHSSETVTLKFKETFCTIVFLRNESPSARECEKDPGRLDVFLQKFEADTKKGERKRRLRIFVPPLILLGAAGIGFGIFGEYSLGLTAIVVVGVALSQYVAEKMR